MIELRQFIGETLKQIALGVVDAQDALDNAEINPAEFAGNCNRMFSGRTGGLVHDVEFDVAVTATDETTTKAGISVLIASVGLGAAGQSAASNQSVSRIRFSVPVVLPIHERGKPA